MRPRVKRVVQVADPLAVAALFVPVIASGVEISRARRCRSRFGAASYIAEDISFIVCAHLPNERAVLTRTIEKLLALEVPAAKEVIVAYNGPGHTNTERRLSQAAEHDRRLRILPVPSSQSKAENLAVAADAAQYGVVGLFDADTWPAEDSAGRALRSLAVGSEVVQGAAVVRDATSPLGALVTSELRSSYQNSKLARSRDGVAYFSGSNAYWRRSALLSVGVSPRCLAEDIEMSMRAVAAQVRLTFDPDLRASETAPASLLTWWHQRRRWMWGWTHAVALNGRAVLRVTRGRRRAWWIFLMFGRRLAPALGLGWLVCRPRLGRRALGPWAAGVIATDALGDRRARARCGGPEVPVAYRSLVPLYELLMHAATLSVLIRRPRTFHVTARSSDGAEWPPARARSFRALFGWRRRAGQREGAPLRVPTDRPPLAGVDD